MDWKKLNMDEIKYFCTSTDIDFDCLPFSYQIKGIIDLFYYYSITRFEIEDIKEFYKKIQIPAPRADGIRKPTPNQIQKAIDSFKCVQYLDGTSYEILNADTEIYAAGIRMGYAENKIIES